MSTARISLPPHQGNGCPTGRDGHANPFAVQEVGPSTAAFLQPLEGYTKQEAVIGPVGIAPPSLHSSPALTSCPAPSPGAMLHPPASLPPLHQWPGGDKASGLRAGRQRGRGRNRGSHQRSCQDFLSPLGPIRDIISKLINRLQMLSRRQGVFLRSSVEHPDKVLGWESCQRTLVFSLCLVPLATLAPHHFPLSWIFWGEGKEKVWIWTVQLSPHTPGCCWEEKCIKQGDRLCCCRHRAGVSSEIRIPCPGGGRTC